MEIEAGWQIVNKSNPSSKHSRDEARYANFFQIGYNAYEFLIEFGQEENIHTRIYVSPQHAQLLSRLLVDTLRQHKELYGTLRTSPDKPS